MRLDVYLNDSEGTIYNIEMQAKNNDNFEKRARYYQSSIDRDTLDKGVYYKNLLDTYIIFVCDFDYYGSGLAVYKKKSYIEGVEKKEYYDGSNVYILNSKFSKGNASEPILEFLSFISKNDLNVAFKSELMKEVIKRIDRVKNNIEMEREYMTLALKMREQREEGIEEGIKQGIQQGIQQGIITLISTLVKYNIEEKEIINEVCEKYNISLESAKQYYDQYLKTKM